MEQTSELDARFGHFGYEIFVGDLIVPYIYRSNEKLFAISMFQYNLLKSDRFPPFFNNLANFHYLKQRTKKAKPIEINRLNEINVVHSDTLYPSTFNDEVLLSYSDAAQIAQYQDDCTNTAQTFHLNCGGFARITLKTIQNREFILPYFIKSEKRLVPFTLVDGIIPGITWRTYTLTNIEMMYMKFQCSLLVYDLDVNRQEIPCIVTEQLTNYCRHIDLNYWPKLNDQIVNPVVAVEVTLNNNQQPVIGDKMAKDAKKAKQAAESMATSESDDEYEVEKILKCRKNDGGQVLIRWKRFPKEFDTWEPIDNLSAGLRGQAKRMLKTIDQNKPAKRLRTKA